MAPRALPEGVVHLRIEVLGPLRVRAGGEIELRRSSHRRLLSILALDANRRLGTDVLIDRFWGEEAPATAKAALQTHVATLRKQLPADVIVTEGYGYRLDLEQHSLDVEAFVALAEEAREAAHARRWEAALESIGTASALWRGRPFQELEDDEFARAEISRLEELRLELMELKAESLLGSGHNREALPGLERLVREHPLRERLWQYLMTARYRLGRHAEALEAYRNAWEAFAELGLEPSGALRRLERKILLHEEAVGSTGTPHNLPVELTRFIGREHELSSVADLLADHRLVTLTGVGGSGKTRLALRVAAQGLEAFPDGCWLVELGGLRKPEHVSLEVASALGLRPQTPDVLHALKTAIASDTTLIVLDNCEHLVHETAALSRALLEAGSNLRVLATSREPLRVPGEVVYDVSPLSFPAEGAGDVELQSFDAVRLFIERAVRARPSFALDRENAGSVALICRRLEGIPLAVELAAARVGSLRPDVIAERLDDRFRILTGGSTTGPARHETLEAAFTWSYDLLDAREQRLFTRLSVFRGGFTFEMAEDVCAGDGVDAADVVPVASTLVEKSLVSLYEMETSDRYRLLETVREFAKERLEETGDADGVARRHLDWCARFAADVNARVHGPGQWQLFERLDDESDNLQAALECSLATGDDDAVTALAKVLVWHWLTQGHIGIVDSYLEIALERCRDVHEEAELRTLRCKASFEQGDVEDAARQAERAYALVRASAATAQKVWVMTRHAHLQQLLVDRDPLAGVPLAREAVEESEAAGDPFAEVLARTTLGRALAWAGSVDEALDQHYSALELALHTGDPGTVLRAYELMYDALYQHPVARRSEPKRITDEIFLHFPPEDERWEERLHWGWPAWVFCQSGDWDRAEDAIHRMSRRHLEGYDQTWRLVVRSALRWMQGRLEEAHADVAEVAKLAPNPRWYHDYFPLVADIAADQRRLEDVRAAADRYFAVAVDPSEEAKKLGVLTPLVRAEVNAALAGSEGEGTEHVERARVAVATGREILATLPPPTAGSLQMETPTTYLALAEAELSRIDGSDPGLWQDAVDRADYFYFRLYARFRLAEALLGAGRADEGADELRAAHADARTVGAERLRVQLEQLATATGVTLTTRAFDRSRAF
jgi:predicted ATPase/DNA-binding SARP family transcriptional activator